MDKKKFGTFIKEKRLEHNLTQQNLADKLYLDVTAISKWERGLSYPDITLISDISKILDISEHELIESSIDTNERKIRKEAKSFRLIDNLILFIPSILYLSTILITFIVNICVSHTLSWFFIVFSSLLVSFTFIPTISRFFNKNKDLIFFLSTFISLSILYLTISIYTKNYWCFIAIISTLELYVLLFFPIYFKKIKGALLIYSLILEILTILLLLVINMYNKINLESINIVLYSFIIFNIVGVVDLFKINRYFKISIDLALSIPYLIFLPYSILNFFNEDIKGYYSIDFSDWNNNTNGNTCFIIIITIVLLMFIFIFLGIRKYSKNNSK